MTPLGCYVIKTYNQQTGLKGQTEKFRNLKFEPFRICKPCIPRHLMLATEWLVLRSIHFSLPKIQIVSKYFINKPYHLYFSLWLYFNRYVLCPDHPSYNHYQNAIFLVTQQSAFTHCNTELRLEIKQFPTSLLDDDEPLDLKLEQARLDRESQKDLFSMLSQSTLEFFP